MSSQVFGDHVMKMKLLHVVEGAGGVVFTERIIGSTQEGEEILTVLCVGVFEVCGTAKSPAGQTTSIRAAFSKDSRHCPMSSAGRLSSLATLCR
jgi:hypothetical protein